MIPSDFEYEQNRLPLRRLGIETHQEAVVYLRDDSPLCRSEGFEAQSRVLIETEDRSIIATLEVVRHDGALAEVLGTDEAGLSEIAWKHLGEPAGATGRLSHPQPVSSLSSVRQKMHGGTLDDRQLLEIIRDIVAGRYADVHIAAFLSACAGGRMTTDEAVGLTRGMISVGDKLSWDHTPIVDKHCVGGLPGNRTTPIVVAIAASCGLTMPKTSSRAITSPAGTADMMETLAPVELSLDRIREVVEKEGGCIAWGGGARLSPADERINRIERALDLDLPTQLVASVLSKKVAAGSTEVVIDVPVGSTAKIRSDDEFDEISNLFRSVAEPIGLDLAIVRTDGAQPVGRGIGPALEARDVLSVLRGAPDAPEDLRDRATLLAGRILEIAGVAESDHGQRLAESTIDDGRAWQKFQRICAAQGGMREPPTAGHQFEVVAPQDGVVSDIDNRKIAKAAKLAGAPDDRAAGMEFLAPLGREVSEGEPLFVLHADSRGELEYALEFVERNPTIVSLEEP